jgi:hypothetical protein
MKTTALREKSRVLAALVEHIDREREAAGYDATTVRVAGVTVELEQVIAGLVEVIETGAFAEEVAFNRRFALAQQRARANDDDLKDAPYRYDDEEEDS